MIERELSQFGYTHAQVGALVARRWGLPDEIAHAINHHHQPGEAGMWVFMARIVDAADHIANASGHGTRPFQDEEPMTSESTAALRLTDEQVKHVRETMNAGLAQMLETFD
jgi:HD-like signal output (HDOD) protein